MLSLMNYAKFVIMQVNSYDLEIKERERTGINTLKIGYNRVSGYYIELTRAQAEQAPADYIRRQTLKC